MPKSKHSVTHSVPHEEPATTELVVKQGAMRQYAVSQLSPEVEHRRLSLNQTEKIMLTVLLAVATYVRCHNLKNPGQVVFDEVHFGGFASKYLNGAFFMDVHPPLAKLLYTFVAFLGGYNGDFSFEKIGMDYPQSVPYVMMRQLAAFCGVGTVLMVFLTLKATGCRPVVSFLSGLLLVFESANATIDRFILLDSPLIFFISTAVYSYIKLEVSTPFTLKWYKALLSTGICLGCAASSKWVGLFTVAWVGVSTAFKLWFVVGDLTVPVRSVWKQAGLRAAVILGTTALVYLFSFFLHFQILTHEGTGASFMSSPFRSSFVDSPLPKSTYADVGVSSVVTVKHYQDPEGYLHSHEHLYEGGSKQQQVTLYPYLDDNNKWMIELYNVSAEPLGFVPIVDGTKIRLKHVLSSRRLHAHDIRPSVSEVDWQNEASCYGFEGFGGDPNDDFVVEIVKDKSAKGAAQSRVQALRTVFRLHHAMTGCYLFSHNTKLPKWGFEQNEVTCAKSGIESLSLWYIEQNTNVYLDQEKAERASYTPLTFWQKVVELNKVMWKVNNDLTQHHYYESKPFSWPALLRGISYWKGTDTQVYLLGNPVVWWLASFVFLPFAIFVAWQLVHWQYGATISFSADSSNYYFHTVVFLLGWFIHYLPSFLMARQMFLHHYLPALYFGILALGQTFDLLHRFLSKRSRSLSYAVLVLFFAAVLFAFLARDPLAFGNSWTADKCNASKWFSSWDYDCNIYPDNSTVASATQVAQPAQTTINFADAVQAPVRDEL